MQRGQLEILVELNEIAGPAGRQRLEPQAVTVLELLASEPGRVWTRGEILDRGWPGRVVSDATLTGVISRLRRSLQRAGITDARIETVSKRGYVLVHVAERARMRPTMMKLAIAAVLSFIALGLSWQHGVLRPTLASPDGVRLDFHITFPDGSTSDPAIWLKEANDGEIHLDGEHPVSLVVEPRLADDGLLRLRIKAAGLSHWTSFEQVIGLDTESRFTLKGGELASLYDIRFVASLGDPPVGPKKITR